MSQSRNHLRSGGHNEPLHPAACVVMDIKTAGLWSSATGDWRSWLTAAHQSPDTIRLRMHQLARLARDHVDRSPWSLTTEELADWLARHKWSAETIRSHRAMLTGFYGWAARVGHTTSDPSLLLPGVRAPQHYARPAPELVFRAALAAAPERTRLMVMLAGLVGLRRGEISRVHTRDLMPDLAGWTLRVHGKGAKVRHVPLLPDVAAVLSALPEGWLFPGQVDGHLSSARVGELVSDALGGDWTCHTLRHRFATTAYAGCRDVLVVKELLGHSKVETTQTYVRLPDEAMRAAILSVA